MIDEVLMFYLYHLMIYLNIFCFFFSICCAKLFLYVLLKFFYIFLYVVLNFDFICFFFFFFF
jgi:hypothetical protein